MASKRKSPTATLPPSLQGLDGGDDQNPRNQHLNAAFRPAWSNTSESSPANVVPQGDTRFDPFLGTGWGDWLDALGAGQPGGVKLAGGFDTTSGLNRLPDSTLTTSAPPMNPEWTAAAKRNPKLAKQATMAANANYSGAM